MDQLNKSDITRVLVEVNCIVAPEDIDILAMFFESRRQSDGGEMVSIKECQTQSPPLNTHLEIVYTNSETAKRILKKRFFSFNNYLLRASENGYQSDVYALNKRKLIIRNVHIDLKESELTSSSLLIIKLYAEHLVPDIDIIDISQSKIFAHTFIITYANDFDKEMLKTRYNKKPTLRKQRVDLIDCFRLNTHIIRGKTNSKGVNIKLNEIITSGEIKFKYFIEMMRPPNVTDDFIIVIQFDLPLEEDEQDENRIKIFNNIIESLQSFCSSNNLILEACHNFELLKLDKCFIEEMNMNQVIITESPQLHSAKFEDKAVQTDLNLNSFSEILLNAGAKKSICSVSSGGSSSNSCGSDDKRKISVCSYTDSVIDEYDSSQEISNGVLVSKASLDRTSSAGNTSDPHASSKDQTGILGEYSEFYTIQKNDHLTSSNYFLDDIEANKLSPYNKDDPATLTLNPSKFYTFVFSRAKQIFINIELVLKSLDANLTLKINPEKSITIKNNNKSRTPEWKSKVMLEIKNFFSKRASYFEIKIAKEIIDNPKVTEKLIKMCQEINKFTSALYFELKNDLLICCGTKQALAKKLQTLPDVFKNIVQQNNEDVFFEGNKNKSLQQEVTQKLNDLDKKNQNQYISTSNIFKASSLIVDIKENTLLFELIKHSKTVLNDLKANLKEVGAELVVTPKIIIRCCAHDSDQLDSILWTKKVQALLNDYEKNRLKEKFIYIPSNIRNEKEIIDLKNHMKRFYDNNNKSFKYEMKSGSKNDSIRVAGMTKMVELFSSDVKAKFNNLENNIKDRIRRKLDLTISKKSQFFQFDILNTFNGVYLKDFSVFLLKYEAAIEKHTSDNNVFVIKCTNEKKIKNEKYVTEWRQTLNEFINRYFSKFSRQKFKLAVKRSEINLNCIQIDPNAIKIHWIDEYEVELVGLMSEIEKVLKQIKPLNIIRTEENEKKEENITQTITAKAAGSANITKVSSKKVPVDSPSSFPSTVANSVKTKDANEFVNELKKSQNQETFLISDLKWFQTRILFEKKYFQFVTETFKNMSVLLDTQLTRMFFTGSSKQEIDEAKQLAFEILGQIMGAEIESDSETLKRMTANENSFNNILKQKGICCVVDTKSSNKKYTIYATTLDEIEACKNILIQMKF